MPRGAPRGAVRDRLHGGAGRRAEDVVATASNPRFSVSRVDVDRGGPTYTIDTLTDLHREHPDAELFFITGADALAQIMSWRDTDRLFQLAHLVRVTRPGGAPAGAPPAPADAPTDTETDETRQ